MLSLVVIASVFTAISATASPPLTCNQNFTCPNSAVSCECEGDVTLRWTVTSSSSTSELYSQLFVAADVESMLPKVMNGYSGILCTVEGEAPLFELTSKLNFTFTENIVVTCRDGVDIADTSLSLQRASKTCLYVFLHAVLVRSLVRGWLAVLAV